MTPKSSMAFFLEGLQDNDRRRDTLDQCGELAEAREQDGKDGRAADDPGREDLRDGQHADVLAVRRVRRRAEEA